jgi:hypothetical protein
MIYFDEYLKFNKNPMISNVIINGKNINYDDVIIKSNQIILNEEKLIKNQFNFNIWEQRGNLLIDLYFIIKCCENINNIVYSGVFIPKYTSIIKNIFFNKNIYFYDENVNYMNYALIHHSKLFDLNLINKPTLGLIPNSDIYDGIKLKIPWYNFLLPNVMITNFNKIQSKNDEINTYFNLYDYNFNNYVVPECYDHCLDCVLELNIIVELIEYLKKRNIETSINYWNILITSILDEKRGL